jgi:hypothetical protein
MKHQAAQKKQGAAGQHGGDMDRADLWVELEHQ